MTLFSAVAAVEDSHVDELLAEQADLTAVERFSQRHEAELEHRQARYYRDLIPLSAPAPGQQLAFEVDLDSCTGCKSCVAACHSLNGLDEDESWRSVTLITGATPVRAFQQTVTQACHHCVEPACLSGCPVDAYEKDPVTGIVSHLDDQCIGCSYCTLTCPYEVPAFNHDRGIVRKCDMCKDRLSAGEAPACVQSCPNGAIAIKVIDISAARGGSDGTLVAGAPPSSITVPTTIYRSTRPELATAAAAAPSGPARSHQPLAVTLVLTQLAVGAFMADLVLGRLGHHGVGGPPRSFDALVAVAAGFLALGASVLHLGRPLYCYRAVIGLRHSWLSREVVAFGAFTSLAAPYSLLVWSGGPLHGSALDAVGALATLAGVTGVACSVLIYVVTHRSSWRPLAVSAKFAGTTVVCGLVTVLWASLATAAAIDGRAVTVALVALAAKLACEALIFRHLRDDGGEGRRRARLLLGDLRPVATLRYGAGLAGGALLGGGVALDAAGAHWLAVAAATVALVAVTTGELAERSLFFTTASAPQ